LTKSAASSAREPIPSFRKIEARWFAAVRGAMRRCFATSTLLHPLSTALATERSRGVKGPQQRGSPAGNRSRTYSTPEALARQASRPMGTALGSGALPTAGEGCPSPLGRLRERISFKRQLVQSLDQLYAAANAQLLGGASDQVAHGGARDAEGVAHELVGLTQRYKG